VTVAQLAAQTLQAFLDATNRACLSRIKRIQQFTLEAVVEKNLGFPAVSANFSQNWGCFENCNEIPECRRLRKSD